MTPCYHLTVITPQGLRYEGDVIHTLVPAERGFVGVLANHAAFVTSSIGGKTEITVKDGQVRKCKAGPGFFEILDNRAVFLTQSWSE
jgi:F0F1-type ATP synthase epsilon subunit